MRAIVSVGDLRTLIADHADDKLINWQVAGQDGTAWNMGADGGLSSFGSAIVISLSHPELHTLSRTLLSAGALERFHAKVREALKELEGSV